MSDLTGEERKQLAVSLYKSGMKPRQICKEIKMGGSVIYRILRENGYQFKTYKLDETCFSDMNENTMYFAGLLMADGCVAAPTNGNKVLYLNSIDDDVLIKFRDYLGDKRRPVSKCGSTRRVQIGDVALIDKLATFGIVPQKTFIAQIPSIEIVLNRHFWRGFIDGDGWYNWNNRNTAQVGIGSASRKIIEQFILFLNHHGLYKKNKIYERKDTTNPFYSYVLRGAEAFDLIDLLYFNSSVHMDRKREKAMEFMYNRNRW